MQGLCQTLDHSVTVHSKPGVGSVFRLSLPFALDAVPERPSLSPGVGAVDGNKLQGIAVLVIDDDESVRAAMLELLQAWGCNCNAVGSLEEAVVSARRERPGLILCDYRLREMQNGATVISSLRLELGVVVPAILVTGDTHPQRLRDAAASGIPLLHKPVSPADLRRRILDVLKDADSV